MRIAVLTYLFADGIFTYGERHFKIFIESEDGDSKLVANGSGVFMKAGKRYRWGANWMVPNHFMVFALIFAICFVPVSQAFNTIESSSQQRLDISAGLVTQDHLLDSVIPSENVRTADVFFHAEHLKTISTFDFPITQLSFAGLIEPSRLRLLPFMLLASVVEVRAPPQSCF